MGFGLPKMSREEGKQAVVLDSPEETAMTGKGTETDFRHILNNLVRKDGTVAWKSCQVCW